jgi:hypothetical protein
MKKKILVILKDKNLKLNEIEKGLFMEKLIILIFFLN